MRNSAHSVVMREAAVCSRMKPRPMTVRLTCSPRPRARTGAGGRDNRWWLSAAREALTKAIANLKHVSIYDDADDDDVEAVEARAAWQRDLDAIRAAIPSGVEAPAVKDTLTPPAVPEGWQLVPKEPTREMIEAGRHQVNFARDAGAGSQKAIHAYRAMLSAAPRAPEDDQP